MWEGGVLGGERRAAAVSSVGAPPALAGQKEALQSSRRIEPARTPASHISLAFTSRRRLPVSSGRRSRAPLATHTSTRALPSRTCIVPSDSINYTRLTNFYSILNVPRLNLLNCLKRRNYWTGWKYSATINNLICGNKIVFTEYIGGGVVTSTSCFSVCSCSFLFLIIFYEKICPFLLHTINVGKYMYVVYDNFFVFRLFMVQKYI